MNQTIHQIDMLVMEVFRQLPSSLQQFIYDLIASNSRFQERILNITGNEVNYFIIYGIVIVVFTWLPSYILAYWRKFVILNIFAEICMFPLLFAPTLIPSTSFRLFFGLFTFTYAMTIHARVCLNIYGLIYKSINLDSSTLRKEWAKTLFFDLPPKLNELKKVTIPPLFKGIKDLILLDASTFLIREWIPTYAKPENILPFQAIIGGIWVMFSIDFSYWYFGIICHIFGYEIPLTIQHCHPLLSITIAEFWSLRWNPIIGKLLQDTFYKPLRRIGTNRFLCMIACFTGSALLHAWPQYLSTKSLNDTIMMFSFFVAQGVCLSLEVITQYVIKRLFFPRDSRRTAVQEVTVEETSFLNFSPSSASLSESGKFRRQQEQKIVKRVDKFNIALKSIPFQGLFELSVIVFIVAVIYIQLEVGWGTLNSSIIGTVFVILCTTMIQLQLLIHRGDSLNQSHPPSMFKLFLRLVGWFWTLSCIISLLPLFAFPVLHSVESLYSKSMFIGPIYRSCIDYFLQ